ncbi:MAG: DUF5317 family protein [Acidimicrobiales bacterium]|jgi:hypothetical protein
MLILPFAVVVGLLAGWMTGGSCRVLSELRFHHSSLVFAAIAAQAALEVPGIRGWPSGVRFAIVLVTYLVVGWWVFENARASSGGARFGLGIVEVGWALNLLAIIPNKGMPVSESALDRAGIAPSKSIGLGHLSKHVLLNHGTVLRALGDVIPLSWFRSVISIGDVVMTVGIGLLVATAMRAPAPENSPVMGPESLTATRPGDSG